MLSKNIIGALAVVIVLMLGSCAEEKYKGEDVTNYPSLSNLLVKNWDMEEPIDYWKVTLSASKKDSTLLKDTDMPWQKIKDIFKKADINKEELNHHYAIDIMQDSVMNSTTVYYKALAPNDFTKKIDIISGSEYNKLTSIYFETATEDGATSKVLFIKNKLIQIQERGSKNEDVKVETYHFPE